MKFIFLSKSKPSHWRIQAGAMDAPGSKFFHFHAVSGKKIAK